MRDTISIREDTCPRCHRPRRIAVEAYPDGLDAQGNVRTAERVLGSTGHQCAPVHHDARMPAGHMTVGALMDGSRQARVTERNASTHGRQEYMATRPRRLADVRQGELSCRSYTPAARFAVTAAGQAYVVRAS